MSSTVSLVARRTGEGTNARFRSLYKKYSSTVPMLLFETSTNQQTTRRIQIMACSFDLFERKSRNEHKFNDAYRVVTVGSSESSLRTLTTYEIEYLYSLKKMAHSVNKR